MRGLQFALLISLVPISLQGNDRVANYAGSTASVRKVTPNFLSLKNSQRNAILNVQSHFQAAKVTTAFVNPLSK
jgi:hypothetical protein